MWTSWCSDILRMIRDSAYDIPQLNEALRLSPTPVPLAFSPQLWGAPEQSLRSMSIGISPFHSTDGVDWMVTLLHWIAFGRCDAMWFISTSEIPSRFFRVPRRLVSPADALEAFCLHWSSSKWWSPSTAAEQMFRAPGGSGNLKIVAPVRWVCLKIVCTPINPMVLLIIIPIKWLFHWEY